MHHQEEYRGHTITAETSRQGNGFAWSYQIDGGEMRESRDRPLRSERVALQEGVGEAKAEIDRAAPVSK